MTREDAIAIASSFVVRELHWATMEARETRHLEAARFNRLFGREVYPSVFWVVDFCNSAPVDVDSQLPNSFSVEVVESTKEVRLIYPGMHVT